MVSVQEHKSHAPASVRCYVLTVSDTRTEANDTGGQAIRQLLEQSGHVVTGHAIVRDEPDEVTVTVRTELANGQSQVIITTGGTGITSRDGTFEAIDRLLDKRLPGFGELFRMISFEEIGPAAMLSRATAGSVARKAIFVLPGSPDAVSLAMTKLILPELGHVVQQLRR
jgi:molybdenum cofactor biosynthesis protein B